MNPSNTSSRLAVCSWSLLPEDPRDLVGKMRLARMDRVQLALDPLRESPAIWGDTADVLRSAGVSIVSGMFGCVGEDYSSLESIRLTGGIAPVATWERNLENIRASAGSASALGLKLVSFHAGFVPHDPADPAFARMVERLATVADVFAASGIMLALETGQETAAGLVALLETLDHPAVSVNFDPANMILYGKGDPVEAVRLLDPWIRQVHVKDAVRSRVPGTWGVEVAVGTGEVDWKSFFATLGEIGYNGDFVIEREAGDHRIQDIVHAGKFIIETTR